MDKKQVVTKLKNTCLTITPVPYYKTPTHNHINITIRAIANRAICGRFLIHRQVKIHEIIQSKEFYTLPISCKFVKFVGAFHLFSPTIRAICGRLKKIFKIVVHPQENVKWQFQIEK